MYTQLFPKAIRMPSISACKARQRIVQLEVSKEPTLWVVSLVRDAGQAEEREPRTLKDDMTIIILPKKKSPENFVWIQHDDFKKAMVFMKHGNLRNSCNASKSLCLARRVKVSLRLWRGDLPRIW